MKKITTSVVFAQNADSLSKAIATLRPFWHHNKSDLGVSDAEYMENHLLEFKGIGFVLQFLGLADEDENSVLGWRAKPQYFEIVTRAKLQRCDAETGCIADHDWMLTQMICSLTRRATEPSVDVRHLSRTERLEWEPQLRLFAYHCLAGIGLFWHDEDGECQSTPLLRELIMQRLTLPSEFNAD